MPFGMKMPSCEIKIKAPSCEIKIKAPSCECEVSLECDIKVKPPCEAPLDGGRKKGKSGKMSGECLSII